MALDTTASASEDRERDQRIQSAKKKLKSYRAKQALLSKRTSGSRQLTSAQAKRISASDPTSAVANAVQDTILAATEQAQQDQTSHESAKRHSRSVSRAGHGRGHSRAGSISVTADRMALATGDALRNSFLAQEQLTQQQQQQQASTDGSSPSTHVVHTRQHSRQHSRSASRRLSFAGGFPSSSSNATILAVEHGPDSFGPAGKPTDWADLPSKVEPRATASHSPLATPRASTRPLSGMATADALFASPNDDAVAAHTTDAAPSARRLSRHTRKTSLATKRESMELMGGLGFPAISVSQDAGLHRLGSQPSASARRASRRISGTNRLSGLQSASVLFGVPDRRSATGKDFDWRGALDQWQSDDVAPSQDDVGGVDDRRTALEKLEGRGAVQAPSVGGPSAADRSSLSASKRHSRSHSRQSSVQLPSFDDIHGQDGMNKRSSVNLLERNERSTLEERDVSGPQRSPASPWLGIPSSSSLGNLSSPSLGSIASLSHSQSSPDLSSSRSPKARPTSLFVAPEAQQPEGLGTLMEEEEEEDVTSPIKERKQPTFDSLLDDAGEVEDEEAQRRRREEERETIKRTRRSSLQPRPLKLKSRPASLFVSPAMQMKANMLLNSPSKPAPQADDIEGIRTADGLLESPRRDIAAGWSFSAAQDKAQARAGDADCENSPAASNTPTRQTPARRSLLLGNVTSIGNDGTDASTEESSPPSPTNGPKHGMRALRLGSGSISGATDSGSSTPTTTLAQRRQSYIAASQSGSSISERSFGLPSSVSANSMRRSSIIYKPSQDSSTSSSVNSAYEELKAKSVRDVATVEEQRRQIEKLTIELSSESQRASHEYAQLEQWSAEERQKLVSRVDQLQVELTQARQDLAEKEAALADDAEKLAAKERQSAEQLEDLQAERDMLQDDVDGWRTRCGDLEKTVQSHKASVEEVEQQKYLLALKVQGLEKRLKEEGIEVVTTPTAEDVAARQLGIPADLASALRSPALSFNTPSVSTPSGYFSPRAAPADAIPPPQAVQLLKDMRQQIFNLAGSLEHQRKEQLKYQEEAQSLQKQNDELRAALEQVSMGFGSAQQDDGSDGRFNFDSTSTPIPSSSSYERRGSGKQRHVFAYDSSMGSVDQSNTSLSSAMGTNMTSMSDHSTSNGLGTPEEKVYSDAGAEGVLPLPAGGLQPLAEEEDEAEEVRAEGSEAEVQPAHVRTVSTFDLEAAGADSYEEDQEDDVEAAEEATYHAAPVSGLPCALSKTPIVSLEGKALSLASSQSGASTQSARSSGSSLQTPGPTSLGDFDDERRHPADVTSDEEDYFEDVEQGQRDLEQDFDDVEALNAQADAHDGVSDDECEDYIGPYSRERKDRPEFIREWSFQEALQSVRHHGGRGAGNGNGKGALSSKRRAQRPPSVDDFFGLMLCEQLDPLPPLPTTHSSLEMPPVYVESLFDVESPAYSPAAGHHQGRSSTSSATGGVTARHAAVTGFKGRPPVARSAYTRDSMSSSVESSVPARGAVVPKARGGSMGMAAAAAASSMVGGGSRALSRVSLQGLTSAFSGLGGYLAGSSGAAVHAAAAASTMCNGRDELDSRNPSISIAHVQRRREDGEGEDETEADDDAAAYYGSAPHTPSAMLQSMPGMMMGGAKRFSGAVAGPAPRSSIPAPPPTKRTSNASSSFQRRFISPQDVIPPTPSPVWSLDFVPCTDVVGGAGAFSV